MRLSIHGLRGICRFLPRDFRRAAHIASMALPDQSVTQAADTPSASKLFGRAFYESIGQPKYIIAPMVDRSEFAWRVLTRSYLSEERSKKLLAYSPMLHARLFGETAGVRNDHFQPTKESLVSKEKSTAKEWLDGNPKIDRPLFVQFCANNPDELLEAAQYVAPYCDAVDLNLGCPQGIARAGKYGAFLQEDWDTIYKLINKLHTNLSVPVTAKIRILDTKEKTLEYAKMVLLAGASILTVHGRRREQKGHNTGVADWSYIRYLRDNLPKETVMFANGNILNAGDLEACLEATGVDGIMSAEGNLSDPTIFAEPPSDQSSREFWKDDNGMGGYRIDGVLRRYLDIIYKYVLERPAPQRSPLYIPSDGEVEIEDTQEPDEAEEGPPRKRQKKDKESRHSPNLRFMQGHLFQLLRPMLSIHTRIRDKLARTRAGDMQGFEKVLSMVEAVTRQGLREAAQASLEADPATGPNAPAEQNATGFTESTKTTEKYKRPWWVCQPHIRPLPDEAIQKGAMTIGKKARAQAEAETEQVMIESGESIQRSDNTKDDASRDTKAAQRPQNTQLTNPPEQVGEPEEVPKSAMVCG